MKDKFSEIILLRKQILDLFHRLEEKRKGMKDNYTTLVSNNDNHFFGLDSFRFQVKLAENELNFLNDQFILIDNRLYCDYYKLYNHVYDYYVENLPHGTTKSVYPIYKDLEPTKVYDTDLVYKLYKDIILLIHKGYETLDHEDRKRETEKRLTTSGIHIGNYVHNRVFIDTLVKSNIQLFEEYLNTYFIYHMTFLVNLKERLGMFLNHVLRREPEQECKVDDMDDNFVEVGKEPATEPIVSATIIQKDENVVSQQTDLSKSVFVSLAETGTNTEDPVVVPVVEPVVQVVEQVVVDQVEPVVEAETKSEEPVVEQVVVPVVVPVVVEQVDPVVEPAVEPVVEPAVEAETKSEEQVVEPVVETEKKDPEDLEEPPDTRTIEEVINPIIDHILGNAPVSAKKKKRPRKSK